jgi:hypothetical protein
MQRQPDCDTRQVVTATGYTALVGSRILQYEEGKTQILAKDAHSACSGGAAYHLSVDRLGARGTRLVGGPRGHAPPVRPRGWPGARPNKRALVTLRAPALELQGLIALSPLPLFRGIATRAAIPTQPSSPVWSSSSRLRSDSQGLPPRSYAGSPISVPSLSSSDDHARHDQLQLDVLIESRTSQVMATSSFSPGSSSLWGGEAEYCRCG